MDVPLCPQCLAAGKEEPLGVLNTQISEDRSHRVRYLGCYACGFRPENNKLIIPIAMAPFHPSRSAGAKRARAKWRRRRALG